MERLKKKSAEVPAGSNRYACSEMWDCSKNPDKNIKTFVEAKDKYHTNWKNSGAQGILLLPLQKSKTNMTRSGKKEEKTFLEFLPYSSQNSCVLTKKAAVIDW